MKTRAGDEYILLEDSAVEMALPPTQRQRLETALVAALTTSSLWVAPSPEFVTGLERDLLRAVRRRQRALQWLGAAGGGVLSLIGGVLIWYLWRRQQAPTSASQSSTLAFRGGGAWRRQPA